SRLRIGVLDALKPYKDFDVVAHEYTTSYEASYRYGYKYLKREVDSGKDANEAGVNTFLNILANMPDTHVARRQGKPAARALSNMARKVLAAGGYSTSRGRSALNEMRSKVLRAGYRPAATADVLAAAFCILLLDGWRP
ncbi:MAG: triphosphoribosyl-dephospho-CoA synthase, partial [Nitrososphaerota archaeon]